MSSCHVLLQIEEIGLGKLSQGITDKLQGKKDGDIGLISTVFAPSLSGVELYVLVFFNAELHHRFGKLTVEEQRELAERLIFFAQQKPPVMGRCETELKVEVELQWAAQKRRRLGLSYAREPRIAGDRKLYRESRLELRLI